MRRLVTFAISIVFAACLYAQIPSKVQYFDLKDVRLLESPFKHAEDLDRQYLLELNADRLLAPFLRESGLVPKAESYTNWENTGLDGHIGGHYVSALSLMYASTGDKMIKERLDYMISELKRCQEANGNGYIGGVPGGKAIWEEIAKGNIRAGSFSLNDKWVPLYNIHKTYAGLRDAYLYAENEDAKEMLIKMTDWAILLVDSLSEDQIQDMLRSEHGGLNEIFADVAAITGDKKYLALAHKFSHQSLLNPLLKGEDRLTGMHANTQIPKVIGFKRIADIEGSQSWSEAARFFWNTVVKDRSVSIGGNSAYEHFHPTDNFSRMITGDQGPETCNTYNMLRLSKMLYQTSIDEDYMNYYERALYNHILSTQHPHNGGLVYFTQMRPGHYRVYSQPQTSFWCCVGSGIENHAKYGEMIYAYTDNELYVNLFIPSTLNWKQKNIEIIQENSFPDKPQTRLIINPKKETSFTLKLRYPEWVTKGELRVKVNGQDYPISEGSENYVSITRKWKKGDSVIMDMPMHITVEQLPDKSNYYSILYGPIVLAAKSGTEDLKGLFADDSRGGHIAHGKQIALKKMPMIVSDPDKIVSSIEPVPNKPLTFKLTGLYPDKYSEGMELIPFFRLHESRYILYWAQATTDDVKKIERQIDEEEREKIKLDSITVDRIVCGEQQPESDHFIKQENSNTGFTEDVHWRDARGWFSYELRNVAKQAKYIYIKYFDDEASINFDILINDKEVSSLTLNGDNGNNLKTAIYPITQSELLQETLVVKFKARPKSKVAKIVEVRILNQK